MKKVLLIVLSLGLIVTLACSGKKVNEKKIGEKSPKSNKEKEIIVPVKLYSLKSGEISSFVLSSATLEAEMSVDIVAETSGIVEELFAEEGDRVKKGEKLATVNFEELKLARDKAAMSFQEAKNKFNRIKDMFAKNLVSREEYDNTLFSFKQSEIDFKNAEVKLEKSIIKAPFSGTVMDRYITKGQYITANQKAFSLVNQEILKVNVFVPEEVVGKIQQGMPVKLESEALKQTFTGKVKRISGVVDPKTGTVKVTVFVDKNKNLRPGMFVKVRILTDTKTNAILVPKKAIVYFEDKKFIFTYDKKGRTVKKVALKEGYQNKDFIETLNPVLKEGTKVVIAGQSSLKDGTKVKVK